MSLSLSSVYIFPFFFYSMAHKILSKVITIQGHLTLTDQKSKDRRRRIVTKQATKLLLNQSQNKQVIIALTRKNRWKKVASGCLEKKTKNQTNNTEHLLPLWDKKECYSISQQCSITQLLLVYNGILVCSCYYFIC